MKNKNYIERTMKIPYFVSVIFKIKSLLKPNFCFYPNLKKILIPCSIEIRL